MKTMLNSYNISVGDRVMHVFDDLVGTVLSLSESSVEIYDDENYIHHFTYRELIVVDKN